MTTADLIAELLGPNWWEREHDQTALCAVLDRVMEEQGGGIFAAACVILKETQHQLRQVVLLGTAKQTLDKFQTDLTRAWMNTI